MTMLLTCRIIVDAFNEGAGATAKRLLKLFLEMSTFSYRLKAFLDFSKIRPLFRTT